MIKFKLMGPPLYMWSDVELNIGMQHVLYL